MWPHLRNFALGNPLPLNTKLLVGIVPNPYAERTVPPYGKSKTLHHPALPSNSGRTQPNRAEDGPTPDKADRRLPAKDGGYIIYVDTRDIKEMNKLLSAIGRNINQIAKRINAGGPTYRADIEEIRERLDQIWQLQRRILLSQR